MEGDGHSLAFHSGSNISPVSRTICRIGQLSQQSSATLLMHVTDGTESKDEGSVLFLLSEGKLVPCNFCPQA